MYKQLASWDNLSSGLTIVPVFVISSYDSLKAVAMTSFVRSVRPLVCGW
jgi:hypothetical protein